MATKFVLTNASWIDLGAAPLTVHNHSPFRIYYIVSAAPPISINVVGQELFTETKEITGSFGQRIYAKVATPRGIYAYREGDLLVAETTDFIRTPDGMSLEDAIEAFKTALASISVLDITDPVPTFGIGNLNASHPFMGMKLQRGAFGSAFWVWNEALDRFVAYLSADDLETTTYANIQAGTFYGSLSGNASSANKLATARNISIEGDVIGNVDFDGADDVAISTALAEIITPGYFTKVQVDGKGRVIEGLSMTANDVVASLGYVPYGVHDASSANAANKLVLRDANGAFSAAIIAATEFQGPLSGNASTATKIAIPVPISLMGDATGSNDFDGSTGVTIPVTLVDSGVTAGTYSNLEFDAKGRVIGARPMDFTDITTALGYTPFDKAGGSVTGNLTVDGDLTVMGTTVTLNVTEVAIEDAIITVAKNNTAGTLPYSGIKVERGPADVYAVWSESDDRWKFLSSTDDLGTSSFGDVQAANFYGALVGNAASASQAAKLTTPRTINTVSFDGTTDISFATDKVTEHASNRYFTEARVRASLSASGGISFNSTTGEFTLTSGTAPVTSVAGRTGAVVLVGADVTDGIDYFKRAPVAVKTAAYTVVLADIGKTIMLNNTTNFTLSLLAAATAGNGFTFTVINTGTSRITIDPNGGELINGRSTITIFPSESVDIVCSGTAWHALFQNNIATLADVTLGVAALSVNLLLPYGEFIDFDIDLFNFAPTVAGTFAARMSNDGGATYKNLANNYAWYAAYISGSTATHPAVYTHTSGGVYGSTAIELSGGAVGVVGTAVAGMWTIKLNSRKAAPTPYPPSIIWTYNGPYTSWGTGFLGFDGPCDAVQFLFSGGGSVGVGSRYVLKGKRLPA